MAYRTETEAWNEDTKDLEYVEQQIKKGVTEDNYFDLCSKVFTVQDRSSLDGVTPKYAERMKYCNTLIEKLNKKRINGVKNEIHL